MIGLAHGQDYEVRKEFNVRVPMRDAVEMSLDIYRPQADGRFPTIPEARRVPTRAGQIHLLETAGLGSI